VCTNARTVRSVDGVATLAIALKDAQRRYHLAWYVSHKGHADDSEAAGENPSSSGPSVAAPGDQYDERSAELMDVLAMLYFVVEVFRSDETFGDELSKCSTRYELTASGHYPSFTCHAVPDGREHEGQTTKGVPSQKVLAARLESLASLSWGNERGISRQNSCERRSGSANGR